MTNEEKQKIKTLEALTKKLYKKLDKKLLFHGWHHIQFVKNKAKEFSKFIDANQFLVESAAIVHDLNYIAGKSFNPESGFILAQNILTDTNYTNTEIERLKRIILESHTKIRTSKISNEGKALSDADTLFKALPITPIVFASKFIQENNINIEKLATKVCEEQNRLMRDNIYFYIPAVQQKYLSWAKTNLSLWNNVEESLKDKDIKKLLEII
ncbi:MAG: HD family phosphohydrolase [Patescibacteria group bacterium]